MYAEALIGPNTVDTMPRDTLDAFRDHGHAALTVEEGIDDAKRTFDTLAEQGINFDDVRNWEMLFERHGVTDIESVVGPFALMKPRQFVRDEGLRNSARIVGRAVSRRVYMRKSVRLMKNNVSIMPKLGYIVLKGTKA